MSVSTLFATMPSFGMGCRGLGMLLTPSHSALQLGKVVVPALGEIQKTHKLSKFICSTNTAFKLWSQLREPSVTPTREQTSPSGIFWAPSPRKGIWFFVTAGKKEQGAGTRSTAEVGRVGAESAETSLSDSLSSNFLCQERVDLARCKHCLVG